MYGIAGEDSLADLKKFAKVHPVGFPILFDDGGKVLDQYRLTLAFDNTAYPQDWVVGTDGKVAWFSNTFDPEGILAVLGEELSGVP